MTKQEFKEFAAQGIHLLDGATGSNLQKRGMPSGICVEQWVCEHEDVLMQLQQEYVEAGSDIVYASTFAANRIKLKEFGLEDQVEELNKKLVAISKKAVNGRALVAGDVTMTGQQLEPLGRLKLEELIDAYKQQMSVLEQAGADLIVVETMMSLQETRAALIAARESVQLPVMVTMSFGEDGRTLYGTDAKTAAVVLEGLGADAVGINCSAGPDKMLSIIKDMREVVSVPVIAKPNAGLPKLGADGMTEYDMEAEEFVQHMHALQQAGASILGGCCGTDPEYIRGVKSAAEEWTQSTESIVSETRYITSERNTLVWEDSYEIGMLSSLENEDLAEEWPDEIYDTMYDEIDDMDDDTEVFGICVDGIEGDCKQLIAQVIKEAAAYTAKPIVFKSSDADVLEAALRNYAGRSAIFSDTIGKDELERIAARYGALVIE